MFSGRNIGSRPSFSLRDAPRPARSVHGEKPTTHAGAGSPASRACTASDNARPPPAESPAIAIGEPRVSRTSHSYVATTLDAIPNARVGMGFNTNFKGSDPFKLTAGIFLGMRHATLSAPD